MGLSIHCFPEYLCPLKIMSILSFVVLTCEEILQMEAVTSAGCQDAHRGTRGESPCFQGGNWGVAMATP